MSLSELFGGNSTLMNLNEGQSKHFIYIIITAVIVALVLIGVGATTNHVKLWNFLKSSRAYVLGVATQIFIVPLIAWLMTWIFELGLVRCLSVMILGSCPGGAISNIVVYFAGGQMELSIAMTCTTTMLAMGFMPLWVFVFTKFAKISVESVEVEVPFFELGTTLVSFLVPIAIGMLLNYKFPAKAPRITRICTGLGGLSLLTVTLAKLFLTGKGVPLELVWSFKVFALAGVQPITTFLVGLLVSSLPGLCCGRGLSGDEKMTIAVEVALQNVKLATAVLLNSFGHLHMVLVQMMVYILLTGGFQAIESLVLIGVVRVLRIRGCMSISSQMEQLDSMETDASSYGEEKVAIDGSDVDEPPSGAHNRRDKTNLLEMKASIV